MTPRSRSQRLLILVATIVTLGSLLEVMVVPAPRAQAVTTPLLSFHSYRHGGAMTRILSRSLGHRTIPVIRTRSRAGQAASGSDGVQSDDQMQLQTTAFPSDFREVDSNALSAADADRKVFSQLQAHSFTDHGMVGGWWQYYTKNMPDGLFDIVYLGSHYQGTDTARAEFDDVAGTIPSVGTTTSCSSGDRCAQIMTTISFSDGQYRGLVRVVQKANAVAEFSLVVPAADFSSLQGTVSTDLDTETNAFLQIFPRPTPTSTPMPPTATPTTTPTVLPTTAPAATPAPVRPTATATPRPAKPATKHRTCKKGYKLVHGKCKKKKKKG